MKTIKFSIPYLHKHKFLLFSGSIILLLSVTSLLMQTIMQAQIIDSISSLQYENLFLSFLIFIFTYIMQCFLFYLKGKVFYKITLSIQQTVSDDLMEKLFEMNYYDYNIHTPNYYLSIFNDVEKVCDDLFLTVNKIERILQFSAICILFFFINKISFFIILLGCAIYFFVQFYFFKKIRKKYTEIFDQQAIYYQNIDESINGIREIKMMHVFSWVEEIIEQTFIKMKHKSKDFSSLNGLHEGIVEAVQYITILLLFVMGIFMIKENILTIGGFLIIYQLGIQLLSLLKQIYEDFVYTNNIQTRVERIEEILNYNKSKVVKELPRISKISFVNVKPLVSQEYDDINLELNLPQKIGIYGKSGIGKSTLLNLLLKRMNAIKGDILINDINIKNIDITTLYNKIGYVSQKASIIPGTLMDNITMGRAISVSEVYEMCEKLLIADLCNYSPQDLVNKYITGDKSLSMGQKQRVILARALIESPEILVLDEASSYLDSKIENEVRKVIFEIMEDKTIICVSHRLDFLSEYDTYYKINKSFLYEKDNDFKIKSK